MVHNEVGLRNLLPRQRESQVPSSSISYSQHIKNSQFVQNTLFFHHDLFLVMRRSVHWQNALVHNGGNAYYLYPYWPYFNQVVITQNMFALYWFKYACFSNAFQFDPFFLQKINYKSIFINDNTVYAIIFVYSYFHCLDKVQ